MNFLLHRHLAAQDLGDEPAGIGAMLPDLWRMADRRVRPSPGLVRHGATPHAGEVLAGVLAGIRHHVEADAWFHRADVFTQGETLTVSRLESAGVSAPRMRLLAHVIWELCLDGALVRHVGLQAILAPLRHGFATAHEASARAAALHHFDHDPDGAARRAVFDTRMTHLCREIERGPWIDGYQDAPNLAIRIQGIRARLRLTPLDAENHQRLVDALESLQEPADDALHRLLEDRAPAGIG